MADNQPILAIPSSAIVDFLAGQLRPDELVDLVVALDQRVGRYAFTGEVIQRLSESLATEPEPRRVSGRPGEWSARRIIADTTARLAALDAEDEPTSRDSASLLERAATLVEADPGLLPQYGAPYCWLAAADHVNPDPDRPACTGRCAAVDRAREVIASADREGVE
jgi:hypothetical protein